MDDHSGFDAKALAASGSEQSAPWHGRKTVAWPRLDDGEGRTAGTEHADAWQAHCADQDAGQLAARTAVQAALE